MTQNTLSQRVYDELRSRLRSGQLRPGTRLVNRTLAKELGTSTIPLREAITRLASERLVEVVPGGGAYVRSPDIDELAELYDVREALEVLAAGSAARFATEHFLADLRSVCDRFRALAAAIPRTGHATPEQLDDWLDCEEVFHSRLVDAARNRWLSKVVADVRVVSQVFAAQRSTARILTRAVAAQTARGHDEFLNILANGDVDAARAWMSKHIRTGRDTVLQFFRAADRHGPAERESRR
jgi:DNA-binding GntR family transcriptional regulator